MLPSQNSAIALGNILHAGFGAFPSEPDQKFKVGKCLETCGQPSPYSTDLLRNLPQDRQDDGCLFRAPSGQRAHAKG
jgi:hypothetical protein